MSIYHRVADGVADMSRTYELLNRYKKVPGAYHTPELWRSDYWETDQETFDYFHAIMPPKASTSGGFVVREAIIGSLYQAFLILSVSGKRRIFTGVVDSSEPDMFGKLALGIMEDQRIRESMAYLPPAPAEFQALRVRVEDLRTALPHPGPVPEGVGGIVWADNLFAWPVDLAKPHSAYYFVAGEADPRLVPDASLAERSLADLAMDFDLMPKRRSYQFTISALFRGEAEAELEAHCLAAALTAAKCEDPGGFDYRIVDENRLGDEVIELLDPEVPNLRAVVNLDPGSVETGKAQELVQALSRLSPGAPEFLRDAAALVQAARSAAIAPAVTRADEAAHINSERDPIEDVRF